MRKIKLGVIFGGMSTEREVSCISATSVIKNLNKEKYEIHPIFIDKEGKWFKVEDIDNLQNRETINVFEYLQNLDIVFPVLHGLYGEDGTIQGMLEMLKIPYVGCGVLASSVGMNKAYTKVIFEKANINQAKYVYIRSYKEGYIYIDEHFNESKMNIKNVINMVESKLKYPVFVKPSNSGSSVGITKAKDRSQLKEAINEAKKYDIEILIEEGITGKEVECAVLGNEDVISSSVGEIKPAEIFYSYNAKYKDENSKTIIPANITEETAKEIQQLAIKAFKSIRGNGLSRVDFFVEEKTNKIYINEINTMPGFTSISMYPKLFEHSGIPYSELLDRIIELSIKKNP